MRELVREMLGYNKVTFSFFFPRWLKGVCLLLLLLLKVCAGMYTGKRGEIMYICLIGNNIVETR